MAQYFPTPEGLLIIPGGSWQHPIMREVPNAARDAAYRFEAMVAMPLYRQMQEEQPEKWLAARYGWDSKSVICALGWENIVLDADAEAKFELMMDEYHLLSDKQQASFDKYLGYLKRSRHARMRSYQKQATMALEAMGESVTISMPRPKGQKFVIHRTKADGTKTESIFAKEDMKDYGEEVTVPGVAPEPDVMTKESDTSLIPCPRVIAVGKPGFACYLCRGPLDCLFERTPGSYERICTNCVWTHLRYEGIPELPGALRRREDDPPLK